MWRFACRFWESSAAREACLGLQDRGWSVTRLLCAAWLATSGKVLPGTESAQVTAWRRDVTEPLRSVKKAITKNNPRTAMVREYIARSELEAERVELALAYQALISDKHTGSGEVATANLALSNLLAAAPEKTMDNETGSLLDILTRELSTLVEGDNKPC
ncbi:TIGR02444 family protein [Marinobacter algicola]|uniref:TIGR02444 family protein n=1 Tax=Marinobacter algicola TaxID=236100 RepID=UPI003BA9B865